MPVSPVVVIPTYNEACNLAELFSSIFISLPDAHIWVVDDQSPDGTADLAEELLSGRDGCRVLRRSGPRGLGNAYCEAFAKVLKCGYSRVVQMDADLSHNPVYLPELIEASYAADLVIGSRYVRGGGVKNWPLKRVLLSRGANVYVRLVTGVPISDATAGFRCWTAEALTKVDLRSMNTNGYAFQVAMAYRAHKAGVKISEVPILFTDREQGVSKMSGSVISESVWMPWRLRLKGK